MCLCYNYWMTLEDTTTLFYLSIVQGSIQISQKEAEHCLCLTENQIWLKFRRCLGIRGFPETQSRIYASSCTENRVCLVADNFWLVQHSSAQLQWCSVSLILFGISGGVPVLIILFLMFWWICLDDLLVEVFTMHKLRGSLSHLERLLGCTDSGGALALLSIMLCWNYDGSEICSLSWGLSGVGLKVIFVV